jgi:uncharacterized protein (TIGR02594 family)
MRTEITNSVGRQGRNNKADVDTVLHLLNLHRRRKGLAPLPPSKKADAALIAAIEEFQRAALGAATPSGTILPRTLETAVMKTPLGTYSEMCYSKPAWLAIATQELERGVREQSGLHRNEPRILEYLKTAPGLSRKVHEDTKHQCAQVHHMSDVDETAWCACFVKWCLTEAGKSTSAGTASAQTWKHYGTQLSGPEVGAIAVIHRTPFDDSSSGWHVGFYVGGPKDAPVLLGGNQGNKVCFSQYFDLVEYHYRWPKA